MRKAAFAAVAVLAVVALSGSDLRSQAGRPEKVDRDRLAAEYVQLTQQLAEEMSRKELETAIAIAHRELARRKSDAVFAPAIAKLKQIAEQNTGEVRNKALTAIQVLGRPATSSGSPEITTVKGTVTMNGRPLANASVVFVPESGRPAGASTDEKGHYRLTFPEGRKGAIVGKNRVLISTRRDPSETEDGQRIPGSPETVPTRYNAQSTLVVEVEEGEQNVMNFDLSSQAEVRDEGDSR